ncbi:hypothetical protein PInf_022820 [Phytophthora infestans]|nr:hypothetical protein PInf_022820 [Phytophthora infestans]
MEDRAKFDVIRLSFVDEANSPMSALNTRSVGINHVVTANSALKNSAIGSDSEAVPACNKTTHYVREAYGRVGVCLAVAADSASNSEVLLSSDVEANREGISWTMKIGNHDDEGNARFKCGVDGSRFADVENSAMSTPEACIIQSVDSASADLNAESDSDMATSCHQDVSYPGDAVVRTEVSSAVAANSADQHSDATKDYDSREVLLHEAIKPSDDPATADSALETLDAENGSDVISQHDVDIT